MVKVLNLDDYIKSRPWEILDPYNCSLHPSVVKDNFNKNNQARFYILNKSVVGHLYPNSGGHIWTLSSYENFDTDLMQEAAKLARSEDRNFSEFTLVSGSKLPTNLPDYMYIKSRDRSEFEYIYKTKITIMMLSKNYATQRRYVKKFIKLYADNISFEIFKDDKDNSINDELLELYQSWLDHASLTNSELDHETKAFKKYLDERRPESYRKAFKIVMRYKGKIIGISINDIVSKNLAINLYFFCNLNMTGISHYLFHQTNKYLSDLGVEELNFQEDRGSMGLRRFKKMLRPHIINDMVTISIDYKNKPQHI